MINNSNLPPIFIGYLCKGCRSKSLESIVLIIFFKTFEQIFEISRLIYCIKVVFLYAHVYLLLIINKTRD